MKHLRLLAFGLWPLIVSVVLGQGGSGAASGSATGRPVGSISLAAPHAIPVAVTGAPYSAEQIDERVQTLNDGTHIRQTQVHTKIYRDSQGRTRIERPLIVLQNRQDWPLVTEITDPVAGVRYIVDPQNKVAHRVKAQSGVGYAVAPNEWFLSRNRVAAPGPPSSPPHPAPAPAAAGARPETTEEKLGQEIIEGVPADGVRHTTTIPAGAEGNDRPFSITSEEWISPDLKIVVLRKQNDPRFGETIMKFVNISRDEPDPSLFQPPPDYRIVEETGESVTIHYNHE